VPQLPRKTRTSRVGSNLKASAALALYEERTTAARRKPLVRARQRSLRDTRAFLTKAVIRSAADVFGANRQAFDLALLKANANGAAIERARGKARRSIDRALQQQINGYAQFRATRRADAEAYRTLVDQQQLESVEGVNLDLGVVVSDQLETQEFGPPYPLYAVDSAEDVGTTVDSSLADPRLGFVINNITFNYDVDSDTFGGFSVGPHVVTRASVGVNYTVPHTGRLTFAAVFQNLYNYVTYSLTDHPFTFSDGDLSFSLSLCARIIRGGSVTGFDRHIYGDGLISHGSSLTGRSFSGLNMATPYTLSATTEETFDEGETIQILVGSSVECDSQLNDMHGFMKALMAWQVKKLYLGV
jgi:hypothetical protein